MPARTTFFIIILTLIATGLVIYSLLAESRKTPTVIVTTPSPTPLEQNVTKDATLSFNPPLLTMKAASSSATTEIVLDGTTHPVTGVQIELSYDPKIITNLQIASSSSSLWSTPDVNVLVKDVDPTLGRATYIAGINPSANPISGVGSVISLSFRVNYALLQNGTEIKILDRSVVTQQDSKESILGEVGNLIIKPLVNTTIPSPTTSIKVTP